MTTTPARVDERLTPMVSTDTLIRLWVDHTPAFTPAPSMCEGCGHHYTTTTPLCPTAALVRPLLWRRRYQYGTSRLSAALTFNQWRDLSDPIEKLSTYTRSLIIRLDPAPAAIPASDDQVPDDLFDVALYRRWGGWR